MHICTVTIASLDIYKVLQGLMRVFFMLYCVNFCTFCILDPLMQLLLMYVLIVLVYKPYLDKFYEYDKANNFIDSFYVSYKSDIKTFIIWIINNCSKVIINIKF